jgi:RNA polymerase sigma factor (sigma-70 family)
MDQTVRCAVTKEHLAVKIARGESEEFEKEAFYESMKKLVFKLVHKYHSTIPDTPVEDLASECFAHLFKSLQSYDPERSKVTTWTYWVCQSKLNGLYGKGKRACGQVSMDFDTPDNKTKCCSDLTLTLQNMFNKMPEHRDILCAMFGDPFCESYNPPQEISCKHVAETVGRSSGNVRKVYNETIKPFLRELLSTESRN